MLDEIKRLVEEACRRESNYFGYGIWKHHILETMRYAEYLADKLNADKEICVLAALLHDYASVIDYNLYRDHHIYSARFAEEILRRYSYPENKIKAIKKCIVSHRASVAIEPETLEAEVVRSADGLAHIFNIPSLYYLAYSIHKLDLEAGHEWVMRKLMDSWGKLMPEAKGIAEYKYRAAIKALTYELGIPTK